MRYDNKNTLYYFPLGHISFRLPISLLLIFGTDMGMFPQVEGSPGYEPMPFTLNH
jgi:hypothetical protein